MESQPSTTEHNGITTDHNGTPTDHNGTTTVHNRPHRNLGSLRKPRFSGWETANAPNWGPKRLAVGGGMHAR